MKRNSFEKYHRTNVSLGYLQCLANGICGPGFGGISGCQPQIQSLHATCQPPCGPGSQCGPYGCTQLRARARGSNVFKPDIKDEELKVNIGKRKFLAIKIY